MLNRIQYTQASTKHILETPYCCPACWEPIQALTENCSNCNWSIPQYGRPTPVFVEVVLAGVRECRRRCDCCAEPHHLLLGLLSKRRANATRFLRDNGVTYSAVLSCVEELIDNDNFFKFLMPIPYSEKAENMYNLALSRSRDLGYNWVNTGHLLLALLQSSQQNEPTYAVFQCLGVEPSSLLVQLLRLLEKKEDESEIKIFSTKLLLTKLMKFLNLP